MIKNAAKIRKTAASQAVAQVGRRLRRLSGKSGAGVSSSVSTGSASPGCARQCAQQQPFRPKCGTMGNPLWPGNDPCLKNDTETRISYCVSTGIRSEERRVGKEG